VREEVHHIRQGKHGARSTKQAIAIGLSKARRAGVDLPPPGKGKTSERTRASAARAYARGHGGPAKAVPSHGRSRAIRRALEREGKSAGSRASLSKQARAASRQRTHPRALRGGHEGGGHQGPRRTCPRGNEGRADSGSKCLTRARSGRAGKTELMSRPVQGIGAGVGTGAGGTREIVSK
jgi:hypothetical protein